MRATPAYMGEPKRADDFLQVAGLGDGVVECVVVGAAAFELDGGE